MRKKLFGLALITAIAPSVLCAQSQPRDTTLTVSITRSGRAPADKMTFYLGIEALAENTTSAVERLQSKIKAVQDTIKRVSPTSVTDPAIMVGVAAAGQNSYPPPQGPVWVARAVMRVNVNRISDLSNVQSAANVAGATINGAASYESSQVDEVWKSKITEALAAARGAAEMSASTQGYKLGALLTTSLTGGGPVQSFQQSQLNFDSRNNPFIQLTPPEVTVNATVTVSYLLVRK